MLPVVIIEWNDAVLRRDLNNTSDIPHEPLVLQSVGFLLKSDEAGVSFCTDVHKDDPAYREQSFIPRGMIVSEIRLGGEEASELESVDRL